MIRAVVTVVLLAALQAGLVGVYYLVEARRGTKGAKQAGQEASATQPVPASGSSAVRGKLPTPGFVVRPAPDLSYRRLDGSKGTLSQHRGKPVLLHFWGTWCPPCLEELPALLNFAKRSDMVVLAVSLDRKDQDVRRFRAGGSLERVVLADPPDDVKGPFKLRQLPVTFVVDAAGRLRKRFEGPQDWGSLAFTNSL